MLFVMFCICGGIIILKELLRNMKLKGIHMIAYNSLRTLVGRAVGISRSFRVVLLGHLYVTQRDFIDLEEIENNDLFTRRN